VRLSAPKRKQSFFEKNTENLCVDAPAAPPLQTLVTKVFWFFFPKKNCFLALATTLKIYLAFATVLYSTTTRQRRKLTACYQTTCERTRSADGAHHAMRYAAPLAIKDDLDRIMDREWNDNQPIYRQLHDRVVAMILDGILNEGDPLPSVRQVAAEFRVNPLTVLKAYQNLVTEGLVQKKRGRGMYVNDGARGVLLRGERQRFLADQWPAIHATIQRLGLTAQDLLQAAAAPAQDGEH
jgi:GntR family transcriptional regulator